MSRVYFRKGSWYVDFRNLQGRRERKSTTARTEREARQLLVAAEAEVNRQRILGERPAPTKVLFRTFMEGEYLKHCQATHEVSTYRAECRRAPALVRALGEIPLNDFSAGHVSRFVDARRTSPGRHGRLVTIATINRELAMVSAALTEAWKRGYIAKDPRGVVTFLKGQPRAARAVSREDEAALLGHAGPDLRAIILVAVHTGLRRSELLRMKWADVDLEARKITVEFAKGKKVRYVPINDPCLAVLREMPRRVDSKADLVFGRWNEDSLTAAFDRAKNRAKVTVTFHGLRHAFATRLLEAGVNIRIVQGLLGHHSLEVTEKYLHVAESAPLEAVQRLAKSGTPEAHEQGRFKFNA